jgi:TrpR-related protein YerC/YecD
MMLQYNIEAAMDDHHHSLTDLCDALLQCENRDETFAFLKDLCTPQELHALAERWRVCQLLQTSSFSYRVIHSMTGASVTTIGRVARFLKDESYQGYTTVLHKMNKGSPK